MRISEHPRALQGYAVGHKITELEFAVASLRRDVRGHHGCHSEGVLALHKQVWQNRIETPAHIHTESGFILVGSDRGMPESCIRGAREGGRKERNEVSGR